MDATNKYCRIEEVTARKTDSYFYEMLVQNGPNHYECADRAV
jgi:hypothetical protein